MIDQPRARRFVSRALLGSAMICGLGSQAAMSAPPAANPAPAAPAPQPAAKKPNIVVILIDDMGFSDIGPYGSEIPTPNLDKLAAGGLRFTQFYNTARCSPSRASLMTGLYPHQAGVGYLDGLVKPNGAGGLQGKIADRAVTMAEVLKPAGYYTGDAGKWHMGLNRGSAPWQRGFDHSLVLGGGTYFPDQPGHEKAQIDGKAVSTSGAELGDNWYASDLLVDWETKFFQQAKQEGKPFFLYLPFTAVHFPVMAPPEDIAKFKGKYMNGYAALREQRFERQKKMGIVPQTEILPAPLKYAYDWSRLNAAQKDRFDTMMATYAGAISRMDKAVGTLVDRLKAAGELDNTLILFMADNGGNAEGGPDGKATGSPLGSKDSNIWVGLNWATLQNTPLQYFKHYTEEGGISTPLIIHWPNGIDPKLNGTFVRTPGHLIDVMPTVVEAAGATYPKTFNGHQILPESGRSMVPAFHGQPLTRSVPIYWEHEGNRAVRDGNWKLVSRFEEPWELYDTTNDRSETKNLAAANPQIVAKMSQQYTTWAKNSFVDQWQANDPQEGKKDGGVHPGSIDGGPPVAGEGPKAGGGRKRGGGKRRGGGENAGEEE